MSDKNRFDYARLIGLFSRSKLTYIKTHDLWVFGAGDSDPEAERVVRQYCAYRAAGRTQAQALGSLGFTQFIQSDLLQRHTHVGNLLERHTAVRERIAALKTQTPNTPASDRAEISIRPHVSYGVHRFWSTPAGLAGTEMIADGLTLPRAQELAQTVARSTEGAELFTMVMDETICVNEATGRREVPAAFEHLYQMLTELPSGVSYTVSLVNLRQNGEKQPALRIQRHIPVPVKKPKPAWEDLTLAEMQQAWIETALREQGYENAKQLRLKAYRERNTEFIAMLDRIGVAVDVVDPGAAVN